MSKATDIHELHAAVKDLLQIKSNIMLGDDSIILFTCGSYGIVIDDDADKIYRLYGWDFANCPNNDDTLPYMLITPQGLQFLRYSKLKVIKYDTSYVVDSDFEDLKLSLAQQRLDYLRRLVKTKELDYPLICQHVSIMSDGYLRKAELTSIRINASSVSVRLDDNENYVLVTGHEWSFKPEATILLLAINDIIVRQRGMIYSLILDNANTIKEQRIRNLNTYNLFTKSKLHGRRSEIVLVREKGFFVTFDDDALTVSEHYHLPLYVCHILSSRDHTSLVIDNHFYSGLIEEQEVDFRVVSPENKRELYDYGFTPSVLNFKGREDIVFKDICVRKSPDGFYYVQATMGDSLLASIVIPNEVGFYFSFLPDGKEKSMMLESIAHHAYDNRI